MKGQTAMGQHSGLALNMHMEFFWDARSPALKDSMTLGKLPSLYCGEEATDN